MWYVIGLIWLALVIGVFWAYRRKNEMRAAARVQQLDALFSDLRQGSGGAVAAGVTAISTQPAAPADPKFAKKPLLPRASALLYYVFRAGLPDHEVFANLTLADVIEVDSAVRGHDHEQKARRLAQQRLDLVICTRQFEVVAAVLIAENVPAEPVSFADACLRSAGIRLLRMDPAALPRHHEVRDMVYGPGSGRAGQARA